MSESKNILMVAAENDALPNAKVGGIGDVVRDIPLALANEGYRVQVVLPDYGHFAELATTECVGQYEVDFAGEVEVVHLFRVSAKPGWNTNSNVAYWALGHENFSPCGSGAVYCDDPHNRPFATDATKYAFFCAAVSKVAVEGGFGTIDVLHLHDWHAALVLLLREFSSTYKALKSTRAVYTIHNLALQGVRPFSGDKSSLETWFPDLEYDKDEVCDPRVPHCLNPMRTGINLADKVHAVSPTYAREIQHESDYEQGVYGGEGLEEDLQVVANQGRLVGILNGCEYPEGEKYRKVGKLKLGHQIREELIRWASSSEIMKSAHWVARERLQTWMLKKERGLLLTSVGRITEQKVRLFKEKVVDANGWSAPVIEHLLKILEPVGTFVLVGSGDKAYEQFLLEVSGRYPNFIFLNGYAHELTEALYSSGDLFIMPSSFEPCGISQMLAMRAGQPCLVHHVGGLKDTVQDDRTGFCFEGNNIQEQAQHFVMRFESLLKQRAEDANFFDKVGKAAQKERFSWANVAGQYIDQLYS